VRKACASDHGSCPDLLGTFVDPSPHHGSQCIYHEPSKSTFVSKWKYRAKVSMNKLYMPLN
jgi:hypothetical protein